MRRFKWLGLGLAVGVLSLGLSVKTYVASWNRKEVMIASVEAKPDLVDEYATVGKDNEWILRNFQPRIISFISENNSNYLLVEYTDAGNTIRHVKVFISGQASSNSQVDKIFFEDSEGQGVWLGFEELENKLTAGEQIRVEYLGFTGQAYNRATCPKYPNFCVLGSIAEKQQLGSELGEKLENGKTDGLIVPAVTLSRQLYEK